MNYRTSISAQTPMALGSLMAPPPGTNMDFYGGLAQAAAVDLDRQAQMANATHAQKSRDAQVTMGLRGANRMADARQNAMNLANSRLDASSGFLSQLLRGLYT